MSRVFVSLLACLKLQPRLPRDLHLGSQSEKARRVNFFNAPEVERVTGPQILRIATTTPQAGPSNKHIEDPASPPGPVVDEPTTFTAKRRKSPEHIFG